MFCRNSLYKSILKSQVYSKNNACERNLFGFGKKPNKDEVVEKKVTEKQENLEKESLLSTNYNMNMLKKNLSLTSKKGYKPVHNVEEIIENVMKQHNTNPKWKDIPLNDQKLKFQLLSSLIKELNHDIPNNELNDMKTMSDVLRYFQTEVKETSTYEDLASGTKTQLPKNLHIQLEALRFHPEEDTMFEGRTAFPGSDTIVTSLKYKRKYEGYRVSREKPGFNNYYYDY